MGVTMPGFTFIEYGLLAVLAFIAAAQLAQP
jgi:Flp pilus assembly pilin Flp